MRGFCYGAIALIFIVLIICGWMVYRGVAVAIQAEDTLQSTIFAVRLVDQFVHDQGHWPKSWTELEQMPFPSDTPSALNQSTFQANNPTSTRTYWPTNSQEIQQRVSIDFQADLKQIASQNPDAFDAIKPIGPYYDAWRNLTVLPLQATIRKSVLHEPPSNNR